MGQTVAGQDAEADAPRGEDEMKTIGLILYGFAAVAAASFLAVAAGAAGAWENPGYGVRNFSQPAAGAGISDSPGRSGGWTERVISEREIDRLGDRDWDLSPSFSRRILARLNVRDPDYIAEDIRRGKPLKVPLDFRRFKDWTPLQRMIPDVAALPRFILIVKDIPFIGWYERGKLIGDTYICIGKKDDWTRTGIFTVKEKDRDHISRSYPNAFGQPAPMPFALRIYETVWIHAGDITQGYCSHGCVNLPIFPAMDLFAWAMPGTPVMIVNSLRDVPSAIAANRSNCALFASVCALPDRS